MFIHISGPIPFELHRAFRNRARKMGITQGKLLPILLARSLDESAQPEQPPAAAPSGVASPSPVRTSDVKVADEHPITPLLDEMFIGTITSGRVVERTGGRTDVHWSIRIEDGPRHGTEFEAPVSDFPPNAHGNYFRAAVGMPVNCLLAPRLADLVGRSLRIRVRQTRDEHGNVRTERFYHELTKAGSGSK